MRGIKEGRPAARHSKEAACKITRDPDTSPKTSSSFCGHALVRKIDKLGPVKMDGGSSSTCRGRCCTGVSPLTPLVARQ